MLVGVQLACCSFIAATLQDTSVKNLQHCRTRTFGTALARALARGTAVKQSAHSYGPGECADSIPDVIRPRARPVSLPKV